MIVFCKTSMRMNSAAAGGRCKAQHAAVRLGYGFYLNISTGTRQVRTIVVVVLPRMKARMGEWP